MSGLYVNTDRGQVARGLALVMLVLILSKLAWYDLKGIFRLFGYGTDYVRTLFYVYSLLLLPIVFGCVGRVFLSFKADSLAIACFLLAAYGAVLGVASQTPVGYLIGDTFKLFLVPAGYWFGKRIGHDLDRPAFLLALFWSILCLVLLRFLVFSVWFQSAVGFIYGTVYDVFAIALAFALMLETPKIRRTMVLPAAILMLALILIGQKRSLFAVLAVMIMFYPLARKSATAAIRLLLITATVAVVGLGAIRGGFLSESVSLGRLATTDLQRKLSFEDGRGAEAVEVWDEMTAGSPLRFVAGGGSGAVFEMQKNRGAVLGIQTEEVHSIHITPLAMLFRYGLIGFGFYWTVFSIALFSAYRGIAGSKVGNTIFSTASGLYLVGASLMSLVIYGLVDDPLVGVCLGYLARRRGLNGAGPVDRRG